MSKKALIQVPVIKGEGSKQIFINKTITLTGTADIPYAYKVHDVDFKVEIKPEDLKVIPGKPGKVIINGKLLKNVVYKAVSTKDAQGVVFGPLRHATVEYEIADFIDLERPGHEIKENDKAEILEAFVEGFTEELEKEEKENSVKVFEKIEEKIIVKIKLKVTRIEHIEVEIAEEHKKEEKKKEECKKEEYKKDECKKEDYKKDEYKKEEYKKSREY